MLGIYVHIPFCESKCCYCSFSSFVKDESFINQYINFLCNEIETSNLKNNEIDSIYIGGGTPSLLDAKQIEKILNSIKNTFILDKKCEITIECNPNSINFDKLIKFKSYGINRISLGVQSVYDEDLIFLCRKHNVKQVFDALDNINLAGFENISVDLLLGLKNSSFDKFKNQIDILLNKEVKHFSCYMLQVEQGTKLKMMYDNDSSCILNNENCVSLFQQVSSYFNKLGFIHYEISNFTLPGYKSLHNYKYWSGEPYIGFGLSAHSYLNGKRIANAYNFDKYFSNEKEFVELLNNSELIEEHIMLGLRYEGGLDINYLNKLGYDIMQNENLKKYLNQNVIFKKNNRLYLNEKFYSVNNIIILDLI